MRKYFLSLVALATILLSVACSKVENPYISENGEMVTFNIAAPEMGTRAYSDGLTANKLTVAVYNQAGEHLAALRQDVSINGSTTVQLPLVTGVTYDIVFWAYAEGAPYTFDADNHTVTLNDTDKKANNEKRDAFFFGWDNYTVSGPKTELVELTRPFAQLNVATLDYTTAVNAGVEITTTNIKVEGVYNSFDLLNGKVLGSAETITLDQAATPKAASQKLKGYETYDWLSMNYLLVNEKTTVTATMNTNNTNVTRQWFSIPLQRNYRTNILGNILTTTTDFNVVIEEGFKGDNNPAEWDGSSIAEPAQDENGVYHIDGAAHLAWLAAAVNGTLVETKALGDPIPANSFEGKVFELGMDIDLKGYAWTPIGGAGNQFRGTFDGQGYTIKNLNVDVQGKTYLDNKGNTKPQTAGLFGASRGYIKNTKIKDANIKANYKAGALIGDGLCAKVENCHVDGGSILLTTDANNDNANHAGGLVGYLSAEPQAYIKNSSAKNMTVTAYRDVAGLVGTTTRSGNNRVVLENNFVQNIVVTADQSVEYIESNKEGNAGAIVGRNNHLTQEELSTNRAIDVIVVGTVVSAGTSEEIEAALDRNEKNILINLSADVTIDVKPWEALAFGGDKTETITINANGYTVTFNQKDSDWNHIVTNNDAKLIIKNANLTNSGYNDGPWNRHDLNFGCDVELIDVKSDKAIALKADGILTDVTINDQNTSDTYALWIQPNGQTVTLDRCTIDMLACTDGRGIKIDEQYVDAPAKVILNVSNTVFKTEEKAAIIVKSEAGAEINLNNVDITEVAADNINAVWVDEDCAEFYDNVIVNGATKFLEGSQLVTSLEELEEKLEAAGAAGAGNTTIVISSDINMTGQTWTPIKVDGYNGADIVTVLGNNKTISGLTAPLFAGGFAGGSGIVIKDLTIDNSNIVSTNTLGSGAFIESVDSMDEITLINCHVKNSTITGGAGSRTGGLIGWTAGYNNVNDGPVKTYVTIQNCSVIKCTITCDGSVGGIYGHAGNNAWTYSLVENCTVQDCILNSTDDGGWRVGVVVGTANVGELTIRNITESGNTLTQTGKTAPEGQSNLYGRFVPGSTGKLIIDGVEIK